MQNKLKAHIVLHIQNLLPYRCYAFPIFSEVR